MTIATILSWIAATAAAIGISLPPRGDRTVGRRTHRARRIGNPVRRVGFCVQVVAVVLLASTAGLLPTESLATVFGAAQPLDTSANGAWAVVASDLDRDGDLDAVVASITGDQVAWYENLDGQGSFGVRRVIASFDAPRALTTADIDGDGDVDVVGGSGPTGVVVWWENTDGLGQFASAQPIATVGIARGVVAADLDGDGDVDVATASGSENTIEWHRNTNGQGSFVSGQVLSTTALTARAVVAADLDGDGDLDVAAASGADDTIAWFENLDGAGTFGPEQILTTTADGARSLSAGDLDRDGDVDLLVASFNDDTIAWYENLDGQAGFGLAEPLSTTAAGASWVTAADFDGDGDLDAIATAFTGGTIAWYENLDGQASFGPAQSLTSTAPGASSVFAADVDGDGDVDVLATSQTDDTVAWYSNRTLHRRVEWNAAGKVDSGSGILFFSAAADLDGDGDSDLFASGDGTVWWGENLDGAGRFGPRQIIAGLGGAQFDGALVAADLDLDGDLDVASIAQLSGALGGFSWYENLDGVGGGWLEWPIAGGVGSAPSMNAVDLDGDLDLDLLVSSYSNDTVAWYENLDGTNAFGPSQPITQTADGVTDSFVGDLDGDGDFDVLAASDLDDTIAWFENLDGRGAFSAEHVISSSADGARAVFAADVDADGDLDVLAASQRDNTIAWFENTNGLGGYGPAQTLSTAVDGARQVVSADLDADGDLDVLASGFGMNTIAWIENLDGAGGFGPVQALAQSANGARSLSASDLDGDGDLDVLGILSDSPLSSQVVWLENDRRPVPDPSLTKIDATLSRTDRVATADLDGDGVLDVLGSSFLNDTVGWYPNLDGQDGFGARQVVTADANGAQAIFAADLDADGDLDVLSASSVDDTIGWSENLDGLGGFGPRQPITTAALGAIDVSAADLDGDGDLDVLSASYDDDVVAWYENLDGLGSFGSRILITNDADGVRSIATADLDRDGDLDVLSASALDDSIEWYFNFDGQGTFARGPRISSTSLGASFVMAADVDGDGDDDVVCASTEDDVVAWFENVDGSASFGPRQVVTTSLINPRALLAADVDRDGDTDLIVASGASPSPNMIYWLENTDGLGSFGAGQIVDQNATTVPSIASGDFDRDGSVDVVSAFGSLAWHPSQAGHLATRTVATSRSIESQGEQPEVLRVYVTHVGRPGDPAAELDTLMLQFDHLPSTPRSSDPAQPFDDLELSALVQDVSVYRDDGSEDFDPHVDAPVGQLAPFALDHGMQAVDLIDGDPNSRILSGQTGLFFVSLTPSAAADGDTASRLRIRHVSDRDRAFEIESNAELEKAANAGAQPAVIAVPEPELAWPLLLGSTLLAWRGLRIEGGRRDRRFAPGLIAQTGCRGSGGT